MKNFCTHSSADFLHFGLALHSSLEKHSNGTDFILHYLCDDEECFELLCKFIKKNKVESIAPFNLKIREQSDRTLMQARNLPASFEAINVGKQCGKDPKEIQHFWSLTPYFTHDVLDHTNGGVLYVDSDCFFFRDWNRIFKVLDEQNASIGLVRHRCPYSPMNGEFNVGITFFRDDFSGKAAAFSWKNWLLGIDRTYWNDYGSCGDQKFLELFPKLFRNVCVLDDFGIIQQAPWNFAYTSQDEDIDYYHFSNFKPDFENDTFIPAPRHNLFGLDEKRELWFAEYYEKVFSMKVSIDEVR